MISAVGKQPTAVAVRASRVVLLCFLMASPATHGDEVILHAGAIFEGSIVSDAGAVLELDTPSGTLMIPRSTIARRTKGPTRWERYQVELVAEPLTAERHIAIARWCGVNNLPQRRSAHVDAALELAPTNPDALTEAGYLPILDLWIKATPPGARDRIDTSSSNRSRAPAQSPRSDSTALSQLQIAWLQYARAIHESMLTSSGRDRAPGDRRREEGMQSLLNVRHAVGLAAICHALSEGTENTRLDLVFLLDQVDGDLAALNLLALALVDGSANVRRSASESMSRRDDVRIDLCLRRALYCQSATIVQRAARAIGMGDDSGAAIDLIQALERKGGYADGPDLASLLSEFESLFADAETIPIGEHGIVLAHRIKVVDADAMNRRPTAGRSDTTTDLRTVLQQSLIDLTGVNHGWDIAAWRTWLASRPQAQ